MNGLAARLRGMERWRGEAQAAAPTRDLTRYARDPVAYMREVLGLRPWSRQEEIAGLLLEPPYRVLVKASHSVGKTWLAAALTSWWYDVFTESACVITTAPTARDVRDLLWSEVRLQRRAAGRPDDFAGDVAPEMGTSPDHFAKGFTAATGESFQGRHRRRMLFVFDEAVGIDPVFWRTTKTMFKPNGQHGWVAIFNPTDTSSQAYAEEQLVDAEGRPLWHVVEMGSQDHPNLQAELRGLPPPHPAAVDLAQFEDWLASWCDPIEAGDATEADFPWPPPDVAAERGLAVRWWRPGPEMEARALGRWPSQATSGVWSDALWKAATAPRPWAPPAGELPELGVDLAAHGDDFTAIHARWGARSVHHERHNGWLPDRTAGRCKELCGELAARATATRPRTQAPTRPEDLAVKFDADGNGGGFQSHAGGYRFVPVSASGRPLEAGRYPNRRCELWFGGAERCRAGLVDLSALPRATRDILRRQLMAPTWKLDGAGRRQVEKKADTKARLGCSPDDADAFNLAVSPAPGPGLPVGIDAPREPTPAARGASGTRPRGGLFGRGR